MRGVTKSERTWANRLIEEFMLAANECVATWLEDLGVPSLYRIHEKPEPRRVVQFEETRRQLRLLARPRRPARQAHSRPAAIAAMRSAAGTQRSPARTKSRKTSPSRRRCIRNWPKRIEGKPEERILSYLMLRSLKQARYSEINEGHFALAAPTYTHFTSPIRRYPDLIVHRITKALLRGGVSEAESGGSALDTTKPGAPFIECQRPRMHGRFVSRPFPKPSSPDRRGNQPDRAPRRRGRTRTGGVEEGPVHAGPRRRRIRRAGPQLHQVRPLRRTHSTFSSRAWSHRHPARRPLHLAREHTPIIGTRQAAASAIGDRVHVVLDRVDTIERRLQFSLLPDAHRLRAGLLQSPGRRS